jgi:hypothetical protein
MSKDRSRGNREKKKPKMAKKPEQTSSPFLRPQQTGMPTASKQGQQSG